MKDFDARDAINGMFAGLRFQMENDIYNNLIAEQANEFDATTFMQMQSIIAAFNKRGVSTKVVLDAFKEALGGGTDE